MALHGSRRNCVWRSDSSILICVKFATFGQTEVSARRGTARIRRLVRIAVATASLPLTSVKQMSKQEHLDTGHGRNLLYPVIFFRSKKMKIFNIGTLRREYAISQKFSENSSQFF